MPRDPIGWSLALSQLGLLWSASKQRRNFNLQRGALAYSPRPTNLRTVLLGGLEGTNALEQRG
jgi:hypothetical protein